MRASSLLGLCCLVSAGAHEQHPIGATGEPAIAPNHHDSNAPSYRSSLLALHKTLVSVPSTSGTEQHVGDVLVDYLASIGYNVKRQFLPQADAAVMSPPRFNVLASRSGKTGTLRPSTSTPRILLTSHMDTVPPHIPYNISDTHPTGDTLISGRGSVDAKASVAAQIIAVEELRRQRSLAGHEVQLLFVVGEETVGDGMRYFSSVSREAGRTFDAAIFGEPTEGKLACGHKGHAGCTIRARGKAGHSGYPWLGKSATEVVVMALGRVLGEDLGSSERFGNTTVNVGVLEGGVAANVIAEHASAAVAFRVAAGDQKTGWEMVRGRVEGILMEVDGEALSMECTNGYGPIECDCDVEGRSLVLASCHMNQVTDRKRRI